MSEGVLPPKHDVANALLRKGSLFVHLDPRVEGVSVPDWLTAQPQLVLQVGFDMVIRIPDLHVDEEGVFGTLSFNRNPFACRIPWPAVFALVGDDGRGLVWPESMPPEIAAEVERESQRARRVAEDRMRPAEPTRELVLHATPGPSAATISRLPRNTRDTRDTRDTHDPADVTVASLINTQHADVPALKQRGSSSTAAATPSAPRTASSTPRQPAKRRELPPYLRVVK